MVVLHGSKHHVPNFQSQMCKVQKYRAKGFFYFSEIAVSLEYPEQGASERLSLQGKLCLAFLEN